ncbi:MAG: PEP-CTERM sorting domain-containing protein [Sphingomonadaceae bacterium]|nr:PEP-CTERM sorting domain-containing protein [Sphingomonadaceae bacterium]
MRFDTLLLVAGAVFAARPVSAVQLPFEVTVNGNSFSQGSYSLRLVVDQLLGTMNGEQLTFQQPAVISFASVGLGSPTAILAIFYPVNQGGGFTISYSNAFGIGFTGPALVSGGVLRPTASPTAVYNDAAFGPAFVNVRPVIIDELPEPGTIAVALLGFGAIALRHRRKA